MPQSDNQISRRNLLGSFGHLLATAGGLSLYSRLDAAAEELVDHDKSSSEKTSYELAPWTGDDFTLGHRLRNRKFPVFPDAPDSKVDFVIIGGGISGLSSAYHLRDHDFLLLEQYADLGGQSSGDSSKGLNFSYGSSQIADPTGECGELLNVLGLHPVRIETNNFGWLFESDWIRGLGAKRQNSLYQEFVRLLEAAKPVWKHCQHGGIEAPISDDQLLTLDSQSLSTSLTGYSAHFIELITSYCKTYLGGGADAVSTLSGFATLKTLSEGTHVLPGGNATIVKLLAQKVSEQGNQRIRKQTFVWSIELRDDYCLINYSDSDGVCHQVRCKHVIVTTPHLVSGRLFSNLSNAARLNFFGYRYCSYLVATLLLKKRILPSGYAYFLPPPLTFSAIEAAEVPYELKGQYKNNMGHALTIYQPYEPGSNGRSLLLAGDRDAFSRSIVEQLSGLCKGLSTNLERVILTRWGHALAVAGPSYFAKLNKLQQDNAMRYSLANASSKGLPRVESAFSAARQATNRALRIDRKASTFYSWSSLG